MAHKNDEQERPPFMTRPTAQQLFDGEPRLRSLVEMCKRKLPHPAISHKKNRPEFLRSG